MIIRKAYTLQVLGDKKRMASQMQSVERLAANASLTEYWRGYGEAIDKAIELVEKIGTRWKEAKS